MHSISDNEETRLQQIALGDEPAFRELVYTYNLQLKTFVFKLTKSNELAEEIVQDVFLKLWLNREILVNVKNFKTFLFVISKNQALNAMRAVLRERNNQKKWQWNNSEQAISQPANENTPAELLEKVVERLPPQQKKAWLLSRRHQKKHSEIADIMQVSKETVKKHIQLANSYIIKQLQEQPDFFLILLFFWMSRK